jgi:hypothetical protein
MKEKVSTIDNNANNHEQREIESNFINGLVWASALALCALVFGPRNFELHLKQSSKT